ncbi:hypothetical protein [Alicyclobacillus mengziensis]|uniref:Uncharacterized protein n=1 Tax=Alicyclobacillus mengziensis TaxID=2931921 RepID=A0A9X7Z9B0_9BACL|nr:hypothetical protein [Alicyclobacillus mengziensis]QSO49443.1 hypothetical protein JZ786_11370 [Alicyclobacillus mengziensis]
MNRTLGIRYVLFGMLFVLVAIGLAAKSYVMLAVLAVAGIVLAVIGDRIENRPTDPYRQYNELHHRKGH